MKKAINLSIKIIVVSIILTLTLNKVDTGSLQAITLNKKSICAIFVVTILTLIQHLIAGTKLSFITREHGNSIKIIDCIKSNYVGAFFTQVGLTFISGDIARVAYLHKKGLSTVTLSLGIFNDRVTGFIALTILYLTTLLSLTKILDNITILYGLYIIGSICVLLILGYVIVLNTNLFRKIVSNEKRFIVTKNNIFPVFFISFIVCLINVLAVIICGVLLNDNLSWNDYFIITIPATLISMLPVSLAGWGIRESAFVAGFYLLGSQTSVGMTISLIIGFSGILASLPGILFIFTTKDQFNFLDSTNNSVQVT